LIGSASFLKSWGDSARDRRAIDLVFLRAIMGVATLKLSGREYVVLPRKQYERLLAPEEDRRDAAQARKTLARFRAGKLKTISHERVKRELG
jgi:hypothetical protein